MIDGPSGYRLIFPSAPKPFEPYPGMTFGYTWFDGLPPERDSIASSRNLLLRFIDQALERYPTPSGKVIMSGFSQGGLMAIDVGFRTTQSLAGIAVMSGAPRGARGLPPAWCSAAPSASWRAPQPAYTPSPARNSYPKRSVPGKSYDTTLKPAANSARSVGTFAVIRLPISRNWRQTFSS